MLLTYYKYYLLQLFLHCAAGIMNPELLKISQELFYHKTAKNKVICDTNNKIISFYYNGCKLYFQKYINRLSRKMQAFF
jgi:hypothetical protein